MESLELKYLAEHFEGKALSGGMHRVVRLPTSYFRLVISRKSMFHEDLEYWLPQIHPTSVYPDQLERYYTSDDSNHILDIQYLPRQFLKYSLEG